MIDARTRPSRRDARKPDVSTLDGHWFTDRITRGVEHAGGEVIGVEIHTKHAAAAKLVELGDR